MKKFKFTFIGLFLFFILMYVATLINQTEISQEVLYLNIFLLILVMFLAGTLDGFNPCAFSTLLLWSGFLLSRFGKAMDEEDIMAKRKMILSYATFYCLGIFFVYLLLGLGILQILNITSYTLTTSLMKVFGFVVILVGLLMVRDYMFPDKKAIVAMPQFFYPLHKKYSEPTTKVASFVSGIIIGLCTVPCGGAIYLAVLLIIQNEPFLYKYSMLLIYNLGFILPVVILALTISNKKMLQALSRDFIRFKSKIKIIMAIVTILMGMMALYMI